MNLQIICLFQCADTISTEAESPGALYVIVFPAVKVRFLGTAALGDEGVFIVPEAAVRTVPVPAAEMVANGRVKTTVLADVAVFMT